MAEAYVTACTVSLGWVPCARYAWYREGVGFWNSMARVSTCCLLEAYGNVNGTRQPRTAVPKPGCWARSMVTGSPVWGKDFIWLHTWLREFEPQKVLLLKPLN